MDPNATWRAGKHPRSHPASIAGDDVGSQSEAESSQQGWSDAGWNASTNPRPSLSSSDDNIPARVHSHSPKSSLSHSIGGPGVGLPNGFPHRRQTMTRASLHTVGSNVTLDSLGPAAQIGPTHYSPSPSGTASPAILAMDKSASSSPRLSPILGSGNGYVHAHPGQATSTSAYAASTYARSRRSQGQIEVETDEEEPYSPGSVTGSSKGKAKRRGRGPSFSLPFHRRRRLSESLPWPLRWWPGGGGSQKPGGRLRSLLVTLILLVSLLYGLVLWRRRYELQVEFSVFSKRWIRQEVDSVAPLRGCFTNPQLLSPEYNMTDMLAPKRHMLSPGISLKRGMSCYDFSSTIQPVPGVSVEHLTYHTYWRSDLIPFGERQTATFLAFLATQPLTHSKLVLWTNGAEAISENPLVKPFLETWGEYIQVKQVDMAQLTKGTQLQGVIGQSPGQVFDQRAWVDGDAVRLLVLWHYGGVWMDMDQVLTRDLHPLTESEWVTQWDCYDKPYFALNGALMHFRQHSPYLCEAFHLMATSPFPKPNTFTWGSHLYAKLHRSLLAAHIKPFGVLPWCFADPRNCRRDNRFPDPFEDDPVEFAGKRWDDGGRQDLEERVGQVWSVHLHNQWGKRFPMDGWVERLLQGYRGQLEVLQRYAEAKGLLGTGGRVKLELEDEA
ncbi:hypothetical protein IAU60_002625 [Kwoniella sp. DSM 27419]